MPNKVSMIVAVDRNGNIGYAGDSKLPWHIPEDLKFFKEKTVGHPIIMGYNTFKSLPGILPNRHHFVVSSKRPEFVNPRMVAGISVFHSLESAIDIAKMHGTEVFVIGGATLYNYALDKKLVNKIYLTSVYTELTGDNLVGINMNLIKREFHHKSEHTLEIISTSGFPLKIKTFYRNS